jgi:polar amino acid transport system substrate-binding protein
MKRPPVFPALLLNLVLSLGLHAPAHAAEPLRLATGEYAPFTGENLPGGGPLTEIARRAFAASDPDLKISFLPWKRGYSETLEGKHDGTFPYGRNAERERDFYFSESYYTVDRRMYYLADSGVKPEDANTLKGRKYCLPLGFVLFKELGAMVESKALEVLSPPDLVSCTKMLLLKRVDFFITTPDIAEVAIAQAGLKESAFVSKSVGKSENFLIVPKTHPKGQAIIATFNKGIAALRAKGDLDKIIKDAKL